MNACRTLDTRLCGYGTQRGSEARQIALEFPRQAFIRRTLSREDALPRRSVALDDLADVLLADRDEIGVDYAAGAGY